MSVLKNHASTEGIGPDLGPTGACRKVGSGGNLLNERKLSIKQAAALMGIGQTSLRRMVRTGLLPVLKIGGKILLLDRDIESYLADCHVFMHETRGIRTRRVAEPEWVSNSAHFI